MNGKESLKGTMDICTMVLKAYVSDLSDAELMHRPGPGCNHLAWQLGHLIASEASLLDSICPNAAPALPDGFAEQHSKETSSSNDPAKFCTKQQYLDLYDRVQAASATALDKMTSDDFDKPSPEKFRQQFPTVGSMFTLIATHPLMHAGQFVPVRRALGKPVLI